MSGKLLTVTRWGAIVHGRPTSIKRISPHGAVVCK